MSSSTSDAEHEATLKRYLEGDSWRMGCLEALGNVAPSAWIGAGFVRSLVFDARAGVTTELEDVDVVYFEEGSRAAEAHLRERLQAHAPAVPWSVKDQARMHLRNADEPYRDLAHAMCHWPEVASVVATRLGTDGVELMAPLGLSDLFAGLIRPTPHMHSRPDRRAVFAKRLRTKRWQERWPGLEVAHSPTAHIGG